MYSTASVTLKSSRENLFPVRPCPSINFLKFMMADSGRAYVVLSASSRDLRWCRTLNVMLRNLFLVLCVFLAPQVTYGQVLGQDDFETEGNLNRDCYSTDGKAQRCHPPFVNAAFGVAVDVTNTCGIGRITDYCLQTGGVPGARKSCYRCDDSDRNLRHPAEYMTDIHRNGTDTWWQSETILEGIQYPNTVNITINLRKAYDITYVQLRFHSPRPDSYAIYKKTSNDKPWVPYQFYSASCPRTYNKTHNEVIDYSNEGRAVCTDLYSDISPLSGGSVPFSTLEGRPSANDFENSNVLQDWVTATAIRIELTRLNTFGDEVFGDPNVLKSYFYAISDLAIGARCKCNGHASQCITQLNALNEQELVCRCEHNTMGRDCEQCLPMYNARPWARATENNVNECQRCNCNGRSDKCYFDQELYERTGDGGHCTECRDNTDGINCERCKENHYERPGDRLCTSCGCNPIGSVDLQCDNFGQCKCKDGVTGDKCDRCEINYYDFGPEGCKPCECVEAGSRNNIARCNPLDGKCECKELVEGRRCDRCKDGYFSLESSNPFGCISCFCYGHSSECTSASGYYERSIFSDFDTGKQRWTGLDRANKQVALSYNAIVKNVGVSAPDNQPVYFVAPSQFLGDRRSSYNQFLTFDLRIIGEDPQPSSVDLVIEGGGQKMYTAIYTQSNPMPDVQTQTYSFRLNEHSSNQWLPSLDSTDFIAILANVTAIKIRGTYSAEGTGIIDNVRLGSASLGTNGGNEATWVESCTCPVGYVGQFCESCAPGYKRDPAFGGPFAKCVPCECNNHSASCEPNSGRCRCENNTEGDNCERCKSGYYGDSTRGTHEDCKPCPCPGGGPCLELPGGDVICTECSDGHGGNLCDVCLDGFYGDPAGKNGPPQPCEPCSCSGNIDPNAVANCNRTTGECLKCIYNTAGYYCENCLPNYFGNALAEKKGDCQPCNCYAPGTGSAGLRSCDAYSGQCPCLPHVEGRMCSRCELGYWNLNSGTGCEECECDAVGSMNYTCVEATGQCQCKPGVTGRRCDQCMINHYGFSDAGCTACNCDPEGSTGLQCNNTGHCPCKTNIEGMHCDRCKENKYNITAGCLDCPACYGLVQDRVNMHRHELAKLKDLIVNIGNNPNAFNDTQFLENLNEVNDSVNMLLMDARGASVGDSTFSQQLAEMKKAVKDVMAKSTLIVNNIRSANMSSTQSQADIQQAQEAIKRADDALNAAENYIDNEGRKALKRAQDALSQFGQQSSQMTETANRAQKESLRQEAEANEIETLANSALTAAQKAKTMADEILGMPSKTKAELERLRKLYLDADRLYNHTKSYAENAKMKAQEAYNEALSLYTEAKEMQGTNIDVPSLLGNASYIKSTARMIRNEAERLVQENQNLLNVVDGQKGEANMLLNDVIAKQQVIDELLEEVFAARLRAEEAIDKAEKTLEEAKNTLETLRGFDQEVQKNKDKAETEMLRIPEIRKMIEEAENKTKGARDALSGAESDADMALKLATQARDIAQSASDEAGRIRVEADQTKNTATGLKDEADRLEEDIASAATDLTALEEKAENDDQLIDSALQKAAQSKTRAQSVLNNVTDALNTVQDISKLLGQLGEVDVDRLNALEVSLNETEQQISDAELDRRIAELELANEEMKRLVTEHRNDYYQLKEDVDNIEQIYLSLPQGCFKNIPIEVAEGQ